MRKISKWAASRRNGARLLIVCTYLLLNALGLFLGDLLLAQGMRLHPLVMYGAVVIFIAAGFFYPHTRAEKKAPGGYRWQKSMDFLLLLATFVMVVSCGNRFSWKETVSMNSAMATFSYRSVTTGLVNPVDPGPRKIAASKEFRKKVMENIQRLRKSYREISQGGKVALTVLTVLVALGLLLLNAALACDLSCSGNEGTAFAVALLGTALVIFLMVLVIRRINKGPRIKQEEGAVPPTGG